MLVIAYIAYCMFNQIGLLNWPHSMGYFLVFVPTAVIMKTLNNYL